MLDTGLRPDRAEHGANAGARRQEIVGDHTLQHDPPVREGRHLVEVVAPVGAAESEESLGELRQAVPSGAPLLTGW